MQTQGDLSFWALEATPIFTGEKCLPSAEALRQFCDLLFCCLVTGKACVDQPQSSGCMHADLSP